MVMTVHEQARRIWSVLVEQAKKSDPKIYYSDLADLIGYGSNRLGKPLDLIQIYCANEGLPQLSILVVEKLTKLPGSGFSLMETEGVDAAIARVQQWDWGAENPFDLPESLTIGDLAERILKHPDAARETYVLVKSRGMTQLIFRAALLRAYKACAICGLTVPECLQACHIVPYNKATAEQRISQNNGILLCANHHLMFDRHWIAIDSRGLVRFRSTANSELICEHDHAATTKLEGQPAFLPSKKTYQPNAEALGAHYEIFKSRMKSRKAP